MWSRRFFWHQDRSDWLVIRLKGPFNYVTAFFEPFLIIQLFNLIMVCFNVKLDILLGYMKLVVWRCSCGGAKQTYRNPQYWRGRERSKTKIYKIKKLYIKKCIEWTYKFLDLGTTACHGCFDNYSKDKNYMKTAHERAENPSKKIVELNPHTVAELFMISRFL